MADWLAAQLPDDQESFDANVADLHQITALALAGAPEAELAKSVAAARADGWSWAPIALLLGDTRDNTRRRFTN